MRRLATATIMLAFLPVGLMAGAQTAVISLGTPNRIGDTLRIPISLTGDSGNAVSAMDFELHYDSRELRPLGIETGSAATAAGKEVQANVVGPGEYKVLMFGFNQSTMSEGDVAYVRFRIMNEPDSGRITLRVANTTVSQTDATAIPSRGDSLTIQVGDDKTDDVVDDDSEESSESTSSAEPDSEAAIPLVARGGGFDGAMDSTRDTTKPGDARVGMRRGTERGATGRREALARALREATAGREILPGGGVGIPEELEGGASSESKKLREDRSRFLGGEATASRVGDLAEPGVGSSEENATADSPLNRFPGENRRGALVAGGIVAALLIAMWIARRKLVT